MAIADVLLRGLAQFLVTRASAELQATVVERLQQDVCPDVETACTFRVDPNDSENDWTPIRNSFPSGDCNNACNEATGEALNSCWTPLRAAGCFYDGSCSHIGACQAHPGWRCVRCLQQHAQAALDGKARRCFNAVIASTLASHTCGLLARNDYFSPSFGNAFRAAVIDDVVALPTNTLHVLMAPLGITMHAGTRDRLMLTFSLAAIDQIMRATSPANAGRELRAFVNAWQCVPADHDHSRMPPDFTCAQVKDALACGAEVFTDAAELAQTPDLPENLGAGVLQAVLTSSACQRAHPSLDDDRRDLLFALVHSFANVTRDIAALRRASTAANTQTPAAHTTTTTTTTTTTPATSPDAGTATTGSNTTQPTTPTTPTEPAAQTLSRDLIDVVNLSIRLGSDNSNTPAFQIPEGVPEFVGAIAANDVASALSRGTRVTARVIEQFSTPAEGISLRAPAAVIRVLSFGADLASARTPDDAQDAFEAFSAPVGSWRGKAHRRMFSITGMVGGGGGFDYTFARGDVPCSVDPVFSLTGMVGADLTTFINNGFFTYGGLFVSLLDVGALVSAATSTPDAGTADTHATINPLQFIAPGAFLHVNLWHSPLNLMAGAQFLPYARTLEYTDTANQAQSVDVSAIRVMGVLTVDVTILPF